MKRFYWMTVLFSAALASAAQADSLVPLEPESFQLNQGAIFQISRLGQGETGKHPRVYLSDPSGELKSLDVPTGKVLWHRTDGGYPLLARDNRLLALLPPSQGKLGCELAILDTRSGKTIKKLLNPTDLILEAPGEGLGDSYQIQCVTQDDRDVLVWTETWHPIPGGAYKGPDYVYPLGSSGQKQGLLVVDLAGGALLPPTGYIPQMSLRSQTDSWGWYCTEPFKVDGVTAQAEMEMIDKKQLLVLRRWKGTESLPEVRLGEPPWNSCGIVVCGDRRNVLGVWQNPEKKNPFTYHIGIYSTATGEKAGELDATSWPSAAQVCGNFLVCYFPTRVFVINLTTGKEVWSQLLKDFTYHGPYPPSARPPTRPQAQEEP